MLEESREGSALLKELEIQESVIISDHEEDLDIYNSFC
jgi:hypothetical protein